jgi:Uma2 family endonuclease
VAVVCGGIQVADKRNDTIINPQVIVEVLSPSAQAYEQGEKFTFYRAIPTLQEYVLIHQERPHVEHFRRQENGWLLTDFTSLDDTLALQSIGIEIRFRRIYARFDWLPPESLPRVMD